MKLSWSISMLIDIARTFEISQPFLCSILTFGYSTLGLFRRISIFKLGDCFTLRGLKLDQIHLWFQDPKSWGKKMSICSLQMVCGEGLVFKNNQTVKKKKYSFIPRPSDNFADLQTGGKLFLCLYKSQVHCKCGTLSLGRSNINWQVRME